MLSICLFSYSCSCLRYSCFVGAECACLCALMRALQLVLICLYVLMCPHRCVQVAGSTVGAVLSVGYGIVDGTHTIIEEGLKKSVRSLSKVWRTVEEMRASGCRICGGDLEHGVAAVSIVD